MKVKSPLSEVIRDQRVNTTLEEIRLAVRSRNPISIPPKEVHYIRRAFFEAIFLGQKKLHEFARSLLVTLSASKDQQVTLEVWGRCKQSEHSDEFLKVELDMTSNVDALVSQSDTLLATKHAPVCSRCQRRSEAIASFVRHEPLKRSAMGPVVCRTRIKATSNICYKIADMVFDIDYMFSRDKIYNEFSQILTDVYGVKIVVMDSVDIPGIVQIIRDMNGIELVEEKDYIGGHKKLSGYEAYKIVVRIERQLIELQLQSESMYQAETSSRIANHRTYKERQYADRKKLGREYQEVYEALRSLFSTPDPEYQELDYVELGFGGKGLDDDW